CVEWWAPCAATPLTKASVVASRRSGSMKVGVRIGSFSLSCVCVWCVCKYVCVYVCMCLAVLLPRARQQAVLQGPWRRWAVARRMRRRNAASLTARHQRQHAPTEVGLQVLCQVLCQVFCQVFCQLLYGFRGGSGVVRAWAVSFGTIWRDCFCTVCALCDWR